MIESGCAVTHWWPLGHDSCSRAEPDIHLQPRAPRSRRRRLSLCSLPVPKQFVVSLRSLISFAQWPTCRTWQSAHGIILMFFILRQVFTLPLCLRTPRQARNPVVCVQPRADRQQSSLPPPAWRGCDCLSASPFRKSEPVRGTAWAPASRPPPAHAECACCAAWKSACATSCRPSSSRLRIVRNN